MLINLIRYIAIALGITFFSILAAVFLLHLEGKERLKKDDDEKFI